MPAAPDRRAPAVPKERSRPGWACVATRSERKDWYNPTIAVSRDCGSAGTAPQAVPSMEEDQRSDDYLERGTSDDK